MSTPSTPSQDPIREGHSERIQRDLRRCTTYRDFTDLQDLPRFVLKIGGKRPTTYATDRWEEERGVVACSECERTGDDCERDNSSGAVRCLRCIEKQRTECSRLASWRAFVLETALGVSSETATILIAWSTQEKQNIDIHGATVAVAAHDAESRKRGPVKDIDELNKDSGLPRKRARSSDSTERDLFKQAKLSPPLPLKVGNRTIIMPDLGSLIDAASLLGKVNTGLITPFDAQEALRKRETSSGASAEVVSNEVHLQFALNDSEKRRLDLERESRELKESNNAYRDQLIRLAKELNRMGKQQERLEAATAEAEERCTDAERVLEVERQEKRNIKEDIMERIKGALL